MRIGIMQPYLFPYIGYFQLIRSVDKFILLDDVAFINRGWINRNNILINNAPSLFTVPLRKASQNKLIKDVLIANEPDWKKPFLRKIALAYGKSRHYSTVFPLIANIVSYQSDNISSFICNSITQLASYLSIQTVIIPGSSIYNATHLKAQDKIIYICKQEQATCYVNAIGGLELYDKQKFSESGIDLFFIANTVDKQIVPDSNLSIIHLLMNHSRDEIQAMLNSYHLQ